MIKGDVRPDLYRARVGYCVLCGLEFRATGDYTNKKTGIKRLQKYCSKNCWSKRKPKKEILCKCCNSVFTTYEGRKVYCSKECVDKNKSILQKGDQSHLWKGGKTKPEKLIRTNAEYRKWRQKILIRDNFKCVSCGTTEGEIHVDHILPLSKYPELALDENNGRVLCRLCHQKTDTWGKKQKIRIKKNADLEIKHNGKPLD